MKKGFTMIELIFVIVILGILASVAIPRLASTREDAEISAAIANLRTLQSDVSAYYVTTGKFATTFKEMSNVQLASEMALDAGQLIGYLKVGSQNDCIVVGTFPSTTVTRDGVSVHQPAFLSVQLGDSDAADPICQTIRDNETVKNYAAQKVYDSTGKLLGNGIAIGSTATVY